MRGGVIKLLRRSIVLVILVFFLFPFIWLVSTSIKPPRAAFAYPPVWIFRPILANYWELLIEENFLKYYLNSLIVSLASTVIALGVGTPAAYALVRFPIRRRKDILFFILAQRMAPPTMVLVPFYLITLKFKMLDHYLPLIIFYLLFNVPFAVWLMGSFFREIPIEIEEAAKIDGCGLIGVFSKVALPLALPGIVTTAVFCMVQSWNEFLFALILTKEHAKTAPVMIATFLRYGGIQWGSITAAGVLIVLPIVIFALISQKAIIRGLTLGAIR